MYELSWAGVAVLAFVIVATSVAIHIIAACILSGRDDERFGRD